MKHIKDVNFKGKRVLLRVDFNVPVDENNNITDDTRIRKSLPTMKKLINDGAKTIIMSHLGRPKAGFEEKFSLKNVAKRISEIIGKEVLFTQSLLGENVTTMVNNMKDGDVMLLENIRFYKGETDGDMEFAKELAKLGDAYINNAFGTAHRNHASVSLLAKLFPNDHYFGFLMEREVENLHYLLDNPKRPFTAIIGGSKISTKIEVLENLISKVDNMIIGGGMRYTFTKALGGKIGNSLHEDDKLGVALDLVEKMKKNNVNFYLPIDCKVIDDFRNDANCQLVKGDEIPDGWEAVDCGPKSIELFRDVILKSKTILWNGPMGVFEMPNFAKGTFGVAEAVAEATKNGAFSVAGGGDSISALQQLNMMDKMSFVSTGGGAMLEYLSGKTLPGLEFMV